MRPHIASTSQSFRKKFTDTFQRSNTVSDPGIAPDGSSWNVLSGLFTIVNNLFTTSTSAASYPLSTVEMGVQNASIELNGVGQGVTAALWVTDSGNWWGVKTFSQGESCNCYSYTYDCSCVPQSASGTYCSTCYTQNCGTYPDGTYYCYGGAYGCDVRVFGVGCVAWYYVAPTCSPNSSYSCTSVPFDCNCVNWSSSWFSCQSCTGYACSTCYPQYLQVIKAISGTVSTVWSQAVAAVVGSLRVKTSGDVITMQAYSDSALSSQIGSDLTYTATGSTKSTKFGLAITPSTYNQASSISKITIDRN